MDSNHSNRSNHSWQDWNAVILRRINNNVFEVESTSSNILQENVIYTVHRSYNNDLKLFTYNKELGVVTTLDEKEYAKFIDL
jgi:hypothetical protein